MKSLFRATLVALVLSATWHASVAHAGLFDDDEARRAILDIRNKIDAIQRDLDNKADKTSALGLSDQNDQVKQEIARLRGQVEVLTNELANTQQRQKDFYVDLDARLRKLEPQQVTVDGKEVSVDPGEQKNLRCRAGPIQGRRLSRRQHRVRRFHPALSAIGIFTIGAILAG